MSDTLLALVVSWGPIFLAVATFLSCLALPVPSSLLMLGGGAFAASGEFSLMACAGSAWAGAVLGDQVGYSIGKGGTRFLTRDQSAGSKLTKSLEKARALTQKWGGIGVFLSRWLLSPLGPYVNFASGAARLDWVRFTFWGALGETVWVSLYTGLGYLFAGRLSDISDILANASGLVTALALMLGSGLWMRALIRRRARA